MNAAVNKPAIEICDDGIDNNCNGAVDEGCANRTDADNDSYFAQSNCGTPVDCNDAELTAFPGNPEFCGDGIDNDCDGVADDTGIGAQTFFVDNDGDGFGVGGGSVVAFSAPNGFAAAAGDCNDGDVDIYPGNTLPLLKRDYIDTGKLRLVIKDLPLSFHANARKAAQAAHCAGEQNAFWPMHDKLFVNNRRLV